MFLKHAVNDDNSILNKFKRIVVRYMPRCVKATLWKFVSWIDFSLIKRTTTIVSEADGTIYAHNQASGKGAYFPCRDGMSLDKRQCQILSKGFNTHLLKKYSLYERQCEIAESDVVIDCGAFVGGFSIGAASRANRVLAIEPSSLNFLCLQKNISDYSLSNVEVFNFALGNNECLGRLNLSKSGCDDSMLKPDEGDLSLVEEVKIITLYNFIEAEGVDPKNLYLKVEAEGFEPEILEGLRGIMPRVVVVDITEERDSLSSYPLVKNILTSIGYKKMYRTDRCLFAVL
jgi:FkbM family methyltransferase